LRYTQKTGFNQRITKQGLQRAASSAQGSSQHQCRQDARQAQVEHQALGKQVGGQ